MRYAPPLALVLALLISACPVGMHVSHGAPLSTFAAQNTLEATSSVPANAYYAAGSLTVSGVTAGDLTALGGGITVAAPVAGDALLAGGVVSVRSTIAGDLRAIGGRVSIQSPMRGDEVIAGGSVQDDGGGAKSVFILGANVTMTKGAEGPVTIYANNVALGGSFSGNVRVVAAGRVSLAEGTTISGTLTYESPEQAVVPSSAKVSGGIIYTGASYLPSSEQAHALVLAAVGVFLLVKILGALILAGLIAGLFPSLAERMAEEAFDRSPRSVLLTALLGFGIMVATPVLLIFLALTFVGLGLVLLIGLAYALLVLLAFVYTGIVLGAYGARRIFGRNEVLWWDAVLGMLAVSLIAIIPAIGVTLVGILAAFCTGALAKLFYRNAFSHEETASLL